MLVMPDGSRIVPTLTVPAVAALNAAMFQVAQVSREMVEVRYVPLSNGRQAQYGQAETELAQQFQRGIVTTFRALKAFDVLPSRKHIEFVNEVDAD